MQFKDLNLSPLVCSAVSSLGLTLPTPIQQQAIPVIMHGRDVRITAPTGSGKTAAFALPLLQTCIDHPPKLRQHQRRETRVLIVVPTRELALQITQFLAQVVHLLKPQLFTPIKVAALHGGVPINPQLMALRAGADIVVSTPGRLLDVIAHNGLDISHVKHCVLDEADKLFSSDFSQELKQVLTLLPGAHSHVNTAQPLYQTICASATYTPDLLKVIDQIQHQPTDIEIGQAGEQAPQITQRAIAVDTDCRTQLLRHLWQTQTWSHALVFVASAYTANTVAAKLNRAGIPAQPFHGQLTQQQRNQTLHRFKSADIPLLITTDLAARGIDVIALPVVINYDLPRSAHDFTHRIGRTARAGQQGIAISFVSASTYTHWRLIETIQTVQIPLETLPGFEPQQQDVPTLVAPDGGGIKGKRPSKKDKLRALALADVRAS